MKFKHYSNEDYETVCDFLIELNRENRDYINWNWARFEWMSEHPEFDKSLMESIGLWTDGEKVVGAAIYDMYFGEAFFKDVSSVVEKYEARNGYTTCMWHNLLTCKIIYDKNGMLQKMKERFSVPYPDQLRKNIIERNTNLLYAAMPAYSLQIKKACGRNDRVSVVHRTAAFLESYFDVIFALNRLTHPGEKRLIELCKQNCEVLPNNFEENLFKLFNDMSVNTDKLCDDIDDIVKELKKII